VRKGERFPKTEENEVPEKGARSLFSPIKRRNFYSLALKRGRKSKFRGRGGKKKSLNERGCGKVSSFLHRGNYLEEKGKWEGDVLLHLF